MYGGHRPPTGAPACWERGRDRPGVKTLRRDDRWWAHPDGGRQNHQDGCPDHQGGGLRPEHRDGDQNFLDGDPRRARTDGVRQSRPDAPRCRGRLHQSQRDVRLRWLRLRQRQRARRRLVPRLREFRGGVHPLRRGGLRPRVRGDRPRPGARRLHAARGPALRLPRWTGRHCEVRSAPWTGRAHGHHRRAKAAGSANGPQRRPQPNRRHRHVLEHRCCRAEPRGSCARPRRYASHGTYPGAPQPKPRP